MLEHGYRQTFYATSVECKTIAPLDAQSNKSSTIVSDEEEGSDRKEKGQSRKDPELCRQMTAS